MGFKLIKNKTDKKILIIGHADHGKTTLAKIINEITGMKYIDSSMAAAKIFIFDKLKDKYNYSSFEECYNDRINHRTEWYNEICHYNKHDKTKLTKEILKDYNIYVGMRSNEELEECIKQELFDLIIGVFNKNKPLESKLSYTIKYEKSIDFIIPTGESIEKLRYRAQRIFKNYE